MNQQTSLHVHFLLHSAVKFALQIVGTGKQKKIRETEKTEEERGEVSNLNQEKKKKKEDVLDIGLRLLFKKKNKSIPSLK